jgi:hypothetical protein
MFITIEDETGVANLVIWPSLYEQQRRVVLGTSLIAAAAGLTPALGALVAGLLLAETEYRRQIEAVIDPFKGLLIGVFLISVGMTLEFGRILAHPWQVLGFSVVLVAAKAAVVVVVAAVGGGCAAGAGGDAPKIDAPRIDRPSGCSSADSTRRPRRLWGLERSGFGAGKVMDVLPLACVRAPASGCRDHERFLQWGTIETRAACLPGQPSLRSPTRHSRVELALCCLNAR